MQSAVETVSAESDAPFRDKVNFKALFNIPRITPDRGYQTGFLCVFCVFAEFHQMYPLIAIALPIDSHKPLLDPPTVLLPGRDRVYLTTAEAQSIYSKHW